MSKPLKVTDNTKDTNLIQNCSFSVNNKSAMCSTQALYAPTREVLLRGRLSTVDLLVLTILDQLIFC
jgi:hypothetical protein